MTVFYFRWVLMVVCLLIFVGSFAALLLASWRHHRAVKHGLENFHDSLAVEIAWTLAPCVIVLLLVWPTARLFWTY
ncbi:MAG: cytochrome c oxidase subunit II transmembrane domain-containing protein [Rhodoferax sp.]|nr:cytochrome c oxidase subunit II transmembrane domain-containing protein [Rhodoferax sp.]